MNAKRFFYDFGRAIYHVDAFYNDFAKSSGVAPMLLWILYALNDGKRHTQKEICTDWQLPKSTVNTVMAELKQKAFVELKPIPGKRREMNVILTDSGKEYADRVLNELYQREAAVFEKLSAEERMVTEKLERLVRLLKETEEIS